MSVESEDPIGEVLVGKVKLAELLKWSPARLDRTLAKEPDFPVRTRGSRGIPWEFELHEVGEFLRGVEERQQSEDAVTRVAKERDDPREARLAVKAARHELTADRMAAKLVSRADCEAVVEAIGEILQDWRARLAAGLKKFDVQPGAASLLEQLVADGSVKFVEAIEKGCVARGDTR